MVRIRSLTVTDFGPYKGTSTIDFDNQVNLILGENGSGKSELFIALELLLFNRKNVDKLSDHLPTHSPTAERYAISGVVEVDGKRVAAEYEFNRKSSTSSRITKVDGVEWQNTEAVQKLNEFLPVDRCYMAMFASEDKNHLIGVRPAERREHAKKIFGVNFNDAITSIDGEIAGVDTKLTEVEKEKYAVETREYEMLTPQRLPCSSEAAEAAQSRIGEIVRILAQEQFKVERIESATQRLREAQSALAKNSELVTQYANEIEEIKENYGNAKEEFESRDWETRRKEINEQLKPENLNAEVNDLQSQIQALPSPQPLPEYSAEQHKADADRVAEIEREIASKLDQIEKCDRGVCPTCERPFVDAHEGEGLTVEQLKHRFQQELGKLRQELSLYNLDQWEELKSKYDQVARENGELEQKKRNLESQLRYAQARIPHQEQSLKAELARLDQERERETELHNTYLWQLTQSLAKARSRHKEAEKAERESREQIGELEKEVERLRGEAIDTTALAQEKEEKEKLYSSYRDTVNWNVYVKEKNAEIEKKKAADQELITQYAEELEENRRYREELVEEKKILSTTFPSYVLHLRLKQLEKHMNEFIFSVYGHRKSDYLLKIRETKTGIDVRYGPHGMPVNLAGGYERAVFSAAYQYAHNVMVDLGVLFLDEVDQKANDRNSEIFYNVLGQKGVSGELQLVAITHRNEIQSLLESEYKARVFEVSDGNVGVVNG